MPKSKTSWKPGQSGNPNGRPKGSGKAGKLRQLLEPHADELVKKAVGLALQGDTTALRLCLERLIPPLKGVDMPIPIAGLEGAQSLAAQGSAVLQQAAEGKLAPHEANTLLQAISAQARVVEVSDLEERIKALEGRRLGVA